MPMLANAGDCRTLQSTYQAMGVSFRRLQASADCLVNSDPVLWSTVNFLGIGRDREDMAMCSLKRYGSSEEASTCESFFILVSHHMVSSHRKERKGNFFFDKLC